REPAVGTLGRPDAIARLVRAARAPRDHFDLAPVRELQRRDDLAAHVREGHRPEAGARGIDEDVLPDRHHGGRARAWFTDRATAGRKKRQRTSSRKSPRGARRHCPIAMRLRLSALFRALSNAWRLPPWP